MNIVFAPQAWADYQHWRSADRTVLARINHLIVDACRSPFEGIGKPEPLQYGLPGAWSRRITGDYRLVYRVIGDDLQIIQTRYHH